jgi:hypothetical protein
MYMSSLKTHTYFKLANTSISLSLTIFNAGSNPSGAIKYSNAEPVYSSWDVTVKVSSYSYNGRKTLLK